LRSTTPCNGSYTISGPTCSSRAARCFTASGTRDELRRIRELTQTINALEAQIADLVAQIAPHLLCEPGGGR